MRATRPLRTSMNELALDSATVADLIDRERDCSCHLCAPNPEDDGCLGWRDSTARLVKKHGWSVVGIGAQDDVPAWVFTVGLWHTYGSPEVAMFGLGLSDM